MKANQRSKIVEKKLRETTAELDATRKELAQVKVELKTLKAQPNIYSEALKVIICSFRFNPNTFI